MLADVVSVELARWVSNGDLSFDEDGLHFGIEDAPVTKTKKTTLRWSQQAIGNIYWAKADILSVPYRAAKTDTMYLGLARCFGESDRLFPDAEIQLKDAPVVRRYAARPLSVLAAEAELEYVCALEWRTANLSTRAVNLKDKVVLIKRSHITPTCRRLDMRVGIATDGFGCAPSAAGSAVYVKSLITGETTRYERYDIARLAHPKEIEYVRAELATKAPAGDSVTSEASSG